MGMIAEMNEREKARYASLIHERLAEIAAQDALEAAGRSTVVLDQQAVGRLSRMDALQSQAMAVAQQQRRGAEAQRLRQALVRIEEGEFGYCESCGEAIAPARLALNLTATVCVACASG